MDIDLNMVEKSTWIILLKKKSPVNNVFTGLSAQKEELTISYKTQYLKGLERPRKPLTPNLTPLTRIW
ncbi:MAG: hypothetical protein ACQEWG_14230 [Bacteroidota bacterium]